MACLLLALTIASQQQPGFSAQFIAGQQSMMGLISSNLSYTNILPENGMPRAATRFPPPVLSGQTSVISLLVLALFRRAE